MSDEFDLVGRFSEAARAEEDRRKREREEREKAAERARQEEERFRAEEQARLARTPRWIRWVKRHRTATFVAAVFVVALSVGASLVIRNALALQELRNTYPRAGQAISSADSFSQLLGVQCSEDRGRYFATAICGEIGSPERVYAWLWTDGEPSSAYPSGNERAECMYRRTTSRGTFVVYGPNWETDPLEQAVAEKLAGAFGATVIPFAVWCEM